MEKSHTNQKMYLYLARKDKKGCKLITVLNNKSNKPICQKIENIKSIELDIIWKTKIDQLHNEHKMLYDLYLETADKWDLIIERLKGRGYTRVFKSVLPLLDLFETHKAPTASVTIKKIVNTMTRKAK